MGEGFAEFGQRVKDVLPATLPGPLAGLGVPNPTPPFAQSIIDVEASADTAVAANTPTVVFGPYSAGANPPDNANLRVLLAVTNLLISYSTAGLLTVEVDGFDETVGGSWSLPLPLTAPDFTTISLYVPGTLINGGVVNNAQVKVTSTMACTVLALNPNIGSPTRSGSRFTVFML